MFIYAIGRTDGLTIRRDGAKYYTDKPPAADRPVWLVVTCDTPDSAMREARPIWSRKAAITIAKKLIHKRYQS